MYSDASLMNKVNLTNTVFNLSHWFLCSWAFESHILVPPLAGGFPNL